MISLDLILLVALFGVSIFAIGINNIKNAKKQQKNENDENKVVVNRDSNLKEKQFIWKEIAAISAVLIIVVYIKGF